jgi:threonine dehydrogenase-like Zn-dependent dehydrogenase
MYTREDVERAIALIASGAVPAGRLVTAEFPLDRVADAFAAARTGAEIKVHVKPQH